ncbi:MAG: hypothetical protein IKY44_02470 [Clostridia bacterium]|nr:hypothetical protein [Clostridia bacterium]
MKIFSLIFSLSFLTYISAIFARPYITGAIWADVLLLLFILACCYQLLYIIFLRKKDSVSLGRSISRYFLHFFSVVIAVILIYYANNFINGFTPGTWVGHATGETVYGFEAVVSDGFAHLFLVPLAFISFLYQIVYCLVSRRFKNKSK